MISQSHSHAPPGKALQSLLSSIFYSSTLFNPSRISGHWPIFKIRTRKCRFSVIKYRPRPQATCKFQSARILKPVVQIDRAWKIEQNKHQGRCIKIPPLGAIPDFALFLTLYRLVQLVLDFEHFEICVLLGAWAGILRPKFGTFGCRF